MDDRRKLIGDHAQILVLPKITDVTPAVKSQLGQADRHGGGAVRRLIASVKQGQIPGLRARRIRHPAVKTVAPEQLPVAGAGLVHRDDLVIGDQPEREVIQLRQVRPQDQR